MNVNPWLVCLPILLLPSVVFAHSVPLRLPLWPADPPEGKRIYDHEDKRLPPREDESEDRSVLRLTNVATPELHVFLPPAEKQNGGAIAICPGGGYQILAWDKEGTEIATFFTAKGFVCAVVKYRVPSPRGEPRWKRPVQDATRAMEVLHERAAEWNIATNKIGILGFSAGADTAIRTALAGANDEGKARATFLVAVYPAYQLNQSGSLREDFLLPSNPPRAFFVHGRKDTHSYLASEKLFQAWRAAGQPAELLLFDTMGHGFGIRGASGTPPAIWPEKCAAWLEEMLR